MSPRLPTALALLLLLPAAVGAQPARYSDWADAARRWTVNVMFENDLFGDTDAQYTNGIELGFVSTDLNAFADRLPGFARRLPDYLPFVHGREGSRNVAFVIGQKMFTPEDVRSTALVPDDRPYAGWLYAGVAFHSKTDRRLDTVEIQAGMVGPASLAQEAQDLVHDMRDIPRARGWDNQLDNEPGLVLIYEQKRRVLDRSIAGPLGIDAIAHAGAVLGNVLVYGSAGAEVRLGWNLPRDFGTSFARPGGETNSPALQRPADNDAVSTGRFGAHAFAALTARAVGRDLFLDGNTFGDSHSVDSRPLVGDLLVGAAFTFGRMKLSYAQVFRTKEFDGQPDHHEFGSVSLSVTF